MGALAVAAVLLLGGAGALWQSREFSALGAIFPRTIGVALLVASVITLWRTVRGVAPPTRGLQRDGLLRGALLVAVISLWIALLEIAGFIAAGVVAYVALALVTERAALTWSRVLRFLVVAIAFVVAFQLIFVLGLKVQLPKGTLW